MDLVSKAKWGCVISSIAIIAFGLCLIIWPNLFAIALCTVVGAFFIACGIAKMVGYFAKDAYGLAFQFDFALGIFAVVIGVIFLFRPENVMAFLSVVIGLYILIDGLFKLQTALDSKRFGLQKWPLIFAASIFTGALGLVLILNPFEGATALLIFMGIALMADGIQNICVVIYTIQNIKKEG